MKDLKLVLVSMYFVAVASVAAKDCVWKRSEDFGTYPPLLMNLDQRKSILPTMENSESVVRIPQGVNVLVACPGSSNMATDAEFEFATCGRSNKLRFSKRNYKMDQVSCKSRVKESVSDTPRPCQVCESNCNNDYYSIGYNLSFFGFYDLIQFRFNQELDTTLWTVHVLRGENVEASDGNPSRPSFKTDSDFFDKSPNSFYQQSSQKQILSNYIDVSKSFYFARGHLSPDADFLSEMEADSTYQYMNVVPQWQAFNNGNWKFLEIATRDLAESHKTDFHIWTGTYGILTLPADSDNEVYLDAGKKIIPAPEITWKIVYEPSTKQAVVLLGSNNPYLETFPETLCPDICDQITWITFDTKVLTKGATYCCSVEEFLKVMPSLSKEAFVDAALLTA